MDKEPMDLKGNPLSMKNWLTYEHGMWNVKNSNLDATWDSHGFFTIDPHIILSVEDTVKVRTPTPSCIIHISNHYYCVRRSREEVIGDIQSAL